MNDPPTGSTRGGARATPADSVGPAQPAGSGDHTDPVLLATPYTAPCRRCGRRLHLTEDELVASLTSPPACWHCDGSPLGPPTT